MRLPTLFFLTLISLILNLFYCSDNDERVLKGIAGRLKLKTETEEREKVLWEARKDLDKLAHQYTLDWAMAARVDSLRNAIAFELANISYKRQSQK